MIPCALPVQGVQQGRGGLHPGRRDEVRPDEPAGQRHRQGDQRDDRDGRQERRRQDQLLRVQVIREVA